MLLILINTTEYFVNYFMAFNNINIVMNLNRKYLNRVLFIRDS